MGRYLFIPQNNFGYILFLKFIYKPLYVKLLKATVSTAHLQIWTKKSFLHVIDSAGFKVEKYVELNEFTMKAEYYLKNMGINNKLILLLGNLFYDIAKTNSEKQNPEPPL